MAGVVVFAVIALLTQFLAYQRYLIFKDEQQQKVLQEANFIKDQLNTSLRHSLSATKTLAFIVERYGVPAHFDSVAASILGDTKAIDALELTRLGEITHVYPQKGNEAAIGYDIFKDSARNFEAYKALEKRQLYFAGPFHLKQGGTAVVGRLPIFRDGEFFGFSVVIIKLETLLRVSGIGRANTPFSYQLSKMNPLAGKEEFFLSGPLPGRGESAFAVEVPDGEWKLYVIPKADFFEIPSGFFISLLGLLFSGTAGLFAWYLVRQPEKLNRLVQMKTSEVLRLKKSALDTIERVSDAFVSLDRNWCYTYMNQKAGEVFGRDPQQMIGRHIWTEFPEGVGLPFYEAYHKAMAEQRYVYLEQYYPPLDQWFENHIYPSPDGLSIYFRNVTEAKMAARRLEESEKYFRALIEKSTDGVVLLDRSRKIIYHSPSTERITGYSFSEIHERYSLDLVEPEKRQQFRELLDAILDTPGRSVRATFQFRHKAGHYIWMEGTYTNWLHDEIIQGVVLNYRDVSERIEAEEKIMSANRVYHFTSRVNQMMIHARDEYGVYEDACAIAVEAGKFRMAWMGKIDPVSNTIVPMSYAGHNDGYIVKGRLIDLTNADVMQGPTATAIRTGTYVYCNDIATDPTMIPWRKEADANGFRASIALPVRKSGVVVGVFHIYSEEAFCFDEEEVSLLVETTRNISFTLENLENEARRRQAEKEIVQEKFLSDSIIDSLPGVFYLYDRNGKFLRWNRNFELVTGYTGSEISQMHPLDFFTGEDRDEVRAKIAEVFASGRAEVTAQFTRKDGQRVPYYYNGRIIRFDDVEYLIGMGIDITRRVNAETELLEHAEEIQKLTGYLQNIREEERTHIAREIHDVIGQQLTAMKMDASWVRRRASGDEAINERLTGMIALIDETIRTVRRISSELRPVMLDDFGLVSALEWQAGEFQKNTGIEASFTSHIPEEELDANLATNIFRVFQEALTNVARHSRATRVEAVLTRESESLKLVVSDNGVGFDPQEVKKKKSLGLVGMKERARMFGGRLEFTPAQGGGTSLVLHIPLKKKENAIA